MRKKNKQKKFITAGFKPQSRHRIKCQILTIKHLPVVLFFFLLIMIQMQARAENITYSTVGGEWQQTSENTWVMDKDGDGTTDVTLVKEGDEWKYYFTVADTEATYYGWEEAPQNGYVIEGQGSRTDPIIFEQNGTIVNKLEKEDPVPVGGITIQKTVISEGTIEKNFQFSIQLSTESEEMKQLLEGTTTFGDLTFTDGTATFYLADGDSVSLSGIPEGITYRIEEYAEEGFETSWSGNGAVTEGTVKEGTITAANTPMLICTNTKKETPIVVPPETRSLSVSKQVINPYDNNDNFSYHLVVWNAGSNQTITISNGQTAITDTSGNADISFTLKNGESISFQGLIVGCQYQVMEEANPYTASYEVRNTVSVVQQNGSNLVARQSLSTEKETVDSGESAEIVFTNTGEEPTPTPTPGPEQETVNIQVRKIWEDNENAANTRPQELTVYLMQEEDMIASAKLDEASGWTASFSSLPKYKNSKREEFAYSVEEMKVPGYASEIVKEQSGNEISYSITNTSIQTGSLKVSKTVTGEGADVNREFMFDIQLTSNGEPVSGTFQLDNVEGTKTGSVNFDENGKSTVSLKNGESVAIKGLPAGAQYIVKERAYSGYSASNDGRYEGTILYETANEVDVLNTCLVPETYNITVSKSVKGNQGDRTKQFQFKLYIENAATPGTIHYQKGSEEGDLPIDELECVSFTLADGETIELQGIKKGTTYAVSEINGKSSGYTVESTNASGILKENTDVSFVNTKNVGIPTSSDSGANTMTYLLIPAVVFICWSWKGKKKKKEK